MRSLACARQHVKAGQGGPRASRALCPAGGTAQVHSLLAVACSRDDYRSAVKVLLEVSVGWVVWSPRLAPPIK